MSAGDGASAEEAQVYGVARDWILYAVHELPAGVLWGPDGANADQCAEMLEGLEDFAKHCRRLGLTDHEQFIEQCRWHFDHYPHSLGRRRHRSWLRAQGRIPRHGGGQGFESPHLQTSVTLAAVFQPCDTPMPVIDARRERGRSV